MRETRLARFLSPGRCTAMMVVCLAAFARADVARLRADRGHGPDARRREAPHRDLRAQEADGPLPIMLMRTPYGIDRRRAQGAGRVPEGPRRRRLHLRLPGHPRPVQVGGDVRHDPSAPRRRPSPRPSTRGPTPTTPSTGCSRTSKDNNGRVGMLGISYPGWLTVMALLEPHPALKAASPQASPADMFLGDDFHHNGAFRLSYGFEYAAMMETSKVNCALRVRPPRHLRVVSPAGPALERQRALLQRQDPDLERLRRAPQLRRVLAAAGGRALPGPSQGADAQRRRLVGPGRFLRPAQDLRDLREERPGAAELPGRRARGTTAAGRSGEGDRLGPIEFGSATGKHFRAKIQAPWFAAHLKDRGPRSFPEAVTFRTGTNAWQSYDRWPPREAAPQRLYAAQRRPPGVRAAARR